MIPFKGGSVVQQRLSVSTLAVMMALMTSSCTNSQYGTAITQDKLSQIHKGVTTRSEVEALLGPPMSTSIMADGSRMLMYFYTDSSSSNSLLVMVPFAPGSMKTRQQNLQIIVDAQGIVKDYEFNDTSSTTHLQGYGIGATGKTTTTSNLPATQQSSGQ